MGVAVTGSSQFVNFADETAFDWERTQAHSMAWWVYLPSNAGNAMVAKATKTGGDGKGIAINSEPNAGPVLDVHLTNTSSGGNHLHAFGPDGFQAGGMVTMSWQHVGYSYDGSSTVAGVKLYVNGLQVTTGAGTNPNIDALSASILTDAQVAIGYVDVGENWNGSIADLILVDSVMTAADFAALADLTQIRTRRDTGNLLSVAPKLWAPLKDSADLKDYSGNAHNGAATGSPTTTRGPSIAYDATGSGTGTSTLSWTHTPRGTTKGVIVMVAQTTASTDRISGVTYGGVAMTRVQFAQDAAGEPGCSYLYFLGSGIPTGAQTVSCTVSAGTEAKKGSSLGLIASGDTRVVTSGKVEGDTADPTLTLATPATFEGICAGTLYSGQNAPSGITEGAGYVGFGSNDFGSQSAKSQFGQKEGANVAFNMTSTIEDVAMVAAAIEVVPADVPTGRSTARRNQLTRT